MENNRLFEGGDLLWDGVIVKEISDMYADYKLTGEGAASRDGGPCHPGRSAGSWRRLRQALEERRAGVRGVSDIRTRKRFRISHQPLLPQSHQRPPKDWSNRGQMTRIVLSILRQAAEPLIACARSSNRSGKGPVPGRGIWGAHFPPPRRGRFPEHENAPAAVSARATNYGEWTLCHWQGGSTGAG